MTSHTTSDQYENQRDVPTTLLPRAWTATPTESVMDDHGPDIFLTDLPHSDVVPTEYLWRECAGFMEVKKSDTVPQQ